MSLCVWRVRGRQRKICEICLLSGLYVRKIKRQSYEAVWVFWRVDYSAHLAVQLTNVSLEAANETTSETQKQDKTKWNKKKSFTTCEPWQLLLLYLLAFKRISDESDCFSGAKSNESIDVKKYCSQDFTSVLLTKKRRYLRAVPYGKRGKNKSRKNIIASDSFLFFVLFVLFALTCFSTMSPHSTLTHGIRFVQKCYSICI